MFLISGDNQLVCKVLRVGQSIFDGVATIGGPGLFIAVAYLAITGIFERASAALRIWLTISDIVLHRPMAQRRRAISWYR